MFDSFWPFLMFAPLFFYLMFFASQARRCPDCGAALPVFMSPSRKTRRMWRHGGFLCEQCGCETDMAGRKVTADTPLPPSSAIWWAIAGAILLGVGIWLTFHILSQPVPSLPAVAAPLQVTPAK